MYVVDPAAAAAATAAAAAATAWPSSINTPTILSLLVPSLHPLQRPAYLNPGLLHTVLQHNERTEMQ